MRSSCIVSALLAVWAVAATIGPPHAVAQGTSWPPDATGNVVEAN